MKLVGILLVFLVFNLNQAKHNYFRTGKKNNLYRVFSQFDISKLAKRQAGLKNHRNLKFVHRGSKK